MESISRFAWYICWCLQILNKLLQQSNYCFVYVMHIWLYWFVVRIKQRMRKKMWETRVKQISFQTENIFHRSQNWRLEETHNKHIFEETIFLRFIYKRRSSHMLPRKPHYHLFSFTLFSMCLYCQKIYKLLMGTLT